MLRLTGTHDGKPAVDYTVNAASGFPVITGTDETPINHALPAWDVIAGIYVANGVLAAELERRSSGTGQEINLALADVMLATVGNLGYVAEIQTRGKTRGNGLYGAYGQSFRTADEREVMVAVISNRHWRSLGDATGLKEKLDMIGPLLDIDLSTEGGRYEAREAIDAVLRPWFAARTAAEATERLAAAGVLQGVFQTFEQLVLEDPQCSTANPLFAEIDQPGIGRVLAPRIPLAFCGSPAKDPQPAPMLGENTDDVLTGILGAEPAQLAALRSLGVLAG
jgi:2-methylfumaryl-CoA isomerase